MNAKKLVRWAVLCLVACAAWRLTAAEKSGSQRWEPDIRAFETADRASPPPEGAVLFVGSSTIRMWTTLAQDFPEYKVLNRGFGGCQIADCTCYADRIVADGKPRVELFVKDRLHFNAEGYKILVARVRKYLTRAAPSPTAPGASKPIAVGRTGARQVLARFLGRRALAVGPSSLMVRPSQIPPRIRTGGDADPTNDPPARLRPLPSGLFIAGDRIEKLLAFQPRLPFSARRCSRRAGVDTGRTGATAAGFDRRAHW